MATPETPSSGNPALTLLKNYWLPLLLGALALTFVLQNRHESKLNFLTFTVTMPEWLSFSLVLLVGVVIGWYVGRKAKK